MRDIKFRAWDKQKQEWFNEEDYVLNDEKGSKSRLCYCDLEGIAIGKEGDIYLIDECGSADYLDRERFEVMQFTGLHDKNGKEIYEGDIVKHRNGIGVVRYDSESVSFQMDLNNCVLDQEVGGYEEVEVIGNIYENPELFKEKSHE